jgi:GT2 family glycosyltransferase
MSIKDITIVIASFKSEKKIKDCLNSIGREFKILVVENSNNSQFKTNIEKEFSNVECILTGENLGYGRANNIGLKRVKTKYVLILNPDTKLDPSAINNFFKAITQVKEFAIMSPYIQEKRDFQLSQNLKNSYPISTKNVKGFAMFLNLSQFNNIGFFDENFFFYFEEIDLCKRLVDSGKKIYLLPEVKIYHDGAQSHDASLNKEMELSRNWHWMWSTFYYHKKHKNFLLSFIIIFPKLSSAFIKVIIYSIFLKKNKKEVYYHRLSGLINAILGKSSWFRPKV